MVFAKNVFEKKARDGNHTTLPGQSKPIKNSN
jgi:hypothetical protein